MANKTKSESANKSSRKTAKAAAVQFINPFKGVAKEERRTKLHDLTSKLRFQAQAEGITDTVNQLLLKYYKEQCGAPVLRTFEEWKQQGKNIRSGSAPFLLWGPRVQSNADSEEQARIEGREVRTFFPLKFVYDIHQVYTPSFTTAAAQ
ncbi:MAG: hypothetical protein MJY68_00385 [Bacteroidaceae bacterium]|nr:hypothetical protein [Bacteroidaceae bacterium]